MRILFYVDVYGKQVRSVMEYFMVPLLVITSILAIIGTIYNKRTANTPGFYIGGAFTVCIVAVTLLSLYDLFVGIQ
jgi:cytochrome c biogenesis protein ResB